MTVNTATNSLPINAEQAGKKKENLFSKEKLKNIRDIFLGLGLAMATWVNPYVTAAGFLGRAFVLSRLVNQEVIEEMARKGLQEKPLTEAEESVRKLSEKVEIATDTLYFAGLGVGLCAHEGIPFAAEMIPLMLGWNGHFLFLRALKQSLHFL